MSIGSRTGWRVSRSDRTRERTVVLNQLLLAMVALLAVVVALAMGDVDVVGMLLGGILLVTVVTAVALAVPWNRLHPLWSALVPISDIAVIALLRESNPSAAARSPRCR